MSLSPAKLLKNSVAKFRKNGIIIENNVESDNKTVYIVGKIDIKIYSCITEDIVTDEVIITDERIQHILERHPNDYEEYCRYMAEVIKNPDYILEANKPNTAFILKDIISEEKHFQLILRLITSDDISSYSNSIITFLKISSKKWNKYLRNKKILYKRE